MDSGRALQVVTYPSVDFFVSAFCDGAERATRLLENLPLLNKFSVHIVVEKQLDHAVRRIEPFHELLEHDHPPHRRQLGVERQGKHKRGQEVD